MTVRILEKFTSLDGDKVFTFPQALAEWESSQGLRNARQPGIGASGSHDFLGYGPAPREDRVERWRCLAKADAPADLEDILDDARATCWSIGIGWLYRLAADGSTRVRTLARLVDMPSITVNGNTQFGIAPLIFGFLCEPDWRSTTATTGSIDFSTSPKTFTITNPGNLPCDDIEFRFRSDGTGPTTDLSLENTTNGYQFSTTRDLTNANHELKVDSGKGTVEYSTDDGATYADDYALFSFGTQNSFMRLDPGDNDMSATVASGTPDVTLEYSFYARYS